MLIGALEAGGINMIASIGNAQRGVMQRASFPTADPESTIPQILEFLKAFDIRALGIGSFGPLDLHPDSPTYGCITDTPKQEWRDYPLLPVMREALGEKVERVVVSTRLTDAPAVVTSEGGVSLAMVQVLKSQPGAEGLPDLHLVLEMNAKHPVFEALRAAHEAGDDDKVRTYAGILFDQALLVEGVMPDNPLAFAQAVSELMK